MGSGVSPLLFERAYLFCIWSYTHQHTFGAAVDRACTDNNKTPDVLTMALTTLHCFLHTSLCSGWKTSLCSGWKSVSYAIRAFFTAPPFLTASPCKTLDMVEPRLT